MGALSETTPLNVHFTGTILSAGWIELQGERKGSFFIIQVNKKISHRCIKEGGVYDERQLGITVEVEGKKDDISDVIFIDKIKQVRKD